MVAPEPLPSSEREAPGQDDRAARGAAPAPLPAGVRALVEGARSASLAGIRATGLAADRLAEAFSLTPRVALSWSRAVWDWTTAVNRSRIVDFARDRFPAEFADLDAADVRILASFVDPDPVSNTVSVLGLPSPWAAFDRRAELRLLLEPASAIAYLRETGDGLAPYVSSERIGEPARRGEAWFFVNGILTTRLLMERNLARLRAMFQRPIVGIHNSSQGLVLDLVSAALQKFTNINTEAVAFAVIAVAEALLEEAVEKVVVLSHSRGTIITGDVLDVIYYAIDPEKYLDRTNMNPGDFEAFKARSFETARAVDLARVLARLAGRSDVVRKLELYLFANAASRVCYLEDEASGPHIESFANEHDIVTRLGCLAWDRFHRQDLLRIDGPVFLRRGQYGHLLNAHYLPGLERGAYELLPPPDAGTRAVGEFVHQRVAGNPCAENPRRAGPTGSVRSRLVGYLREAGRSSPDP